MRVTGLVNTTKYTFRERFHLLLQDINFSNRATFWKQTIETNNLHVTKYAWIVGQYLASQWKEGIQK